MSTMSSITDTNIDSFKTEHECDEHWELRRKFLLAHKDRFHLDELLCMAQVFTNVEFLGCRYPHETMRMLTELSKEVAGDYREKQKNRLRRTFVGASDAASSKAKGQGRQQPEKSSNPSNVNNRQLQFVQQQQPEQRISFGESSQKSCPSLSTTFKRKEGTTQALRIDTKKKKQQNTSKKADVVLFEHYNDTPQGMIARAASTYDIDLEWKFDKKGEDSVCTVLFNGYKVAAAEGANQKISKKDAATIALNEMKKIYYTIKVTKNLTPTVTDNLDSNNTKSDAIGNDNIGMKMMKLMGWSGGGLGKTSQGITEPVNVQQQMTREGLGLKPGMYNMGVFKKKCTEVLQNYIKGDTSIDLVFSPSFSNEERALIHQIAKQLGLKSQSYGPKSQRTLTISRKINAQELVNELIALGGSTEKYQLIEPTGE